MGQDPKYIRIFMNKNHMFSFFILLSLTLQISASVDEIKGEKPYFNFTKNTIEKVNTCRNVIVGLMIPAD